MPIYVTPTRQTKYINTVYSLLNDQIVARKKNPKT